MQADFRTVGDRMYEEYLERPHAKQAMEYFHQGYNCAQSVVLSFKEECGLDEKTLLRLSSSFGAGMGRLREVCGATSGSFVVLGLIYGYDDPRDREGKIEHYRKIQEVAGRIKEVNGSIICKELLGLTGKKFSHVPEERTKEYYEKRPCGQIVGMTAGILEEYIEKEGIRQ
jgi:C_GCAxxG_C_C family probable redox protein